MTTLDILGLQRRMRQLGEIRIGHVVDTGKISERTGKPIKRPAKLDKFRLTSASKPTLEEVAKLYGGQVQAWAPANGGPSEWEVYTETDRLPVIIPPANAVTQSFEMYKGSKCVRRCDGRIEEKSDRPCMCDPEQRACLLTTRLNVMLRDVQGLGVWLLTSHGFYAAVELPPVVEFLASTNGYVDAFLTMELKRVMRDDGPAAEFMVPKIDVAVTPAQLLAGQGAISAPAIAATQQRAALTGDRPVIAGTAAAIEAPAQDRPDFIGLIKIAATRDDVLKIWEQAKAAGAPAGPVEAAAVARVAELKEQTAQRHIAAALASQTLPELVTALKAAVADGFAKDPSDQSDPVTAAFVARRTLLEGQASAPEPAREAASAEVLWAEIVTAAGFEGFDLTADIENAFAARYQGETPGTASPDRLAEFLQAMRDGQIRPAGAAPAAVSAPTASGIDEEPPF